MQTIKKKKKGKKLIFFAIFVLVLIIVAGLLFDFGGFGLGLLGRNDGSGEAQQADNRDRNDPERDDEQNRTANNVLPDVIDAVPAPVPFIEIRVAGNNLFRGPLTTDGEQAGLADIYALRALLDEIGDNHDWVITNDNATVAMLQAVQYEFSSRGIEAPVGIG